MWDEHSSPITRMVTHPGTSKGRLMLDPEHVNDRDQPPRHPQATRLYIYLRFTHFNLFCTIIDVNSGLLDFYIHSVFPAIFTAYINMEFIIVMLYVT